jgi:hypothetical protein
MLSSVDRLTFTPPFTVPFSTILDKFHPPGPRMLRPLYWGRKAFGDDTACPRPPGPVRSLAVPPRRGGSEYQWIPKFDTGKIYF